MWDWTYFGPSYKIKVGFRPVLDHSKFRSWKILRNNGKYRKNLKYHIFELISLSTRFQAWRCDPLHHLHYNNFETSDVRLCRIKMRLTPNKKCVVGGVVFAVWFVTFMTEKHTASVFFCPLIRSALSRPTRGHEIEGAESNVIGSEARWMTKKNTFSSKSRF